MNNKNIIVLIICVVIFSALAFYGGMKFSSTKTPSAAANMVRFGEGSRNRSISQEFTRGEIVSVDKDNIVVKLDDGSSKIILISDSTQVSKTEKAEKSVLKTGDNIAVMGKSNSDGSQTANSIQINPVQFQIRRP